jgi:hypothetical protein
MLKIIFLDIDGVLNNESLFSKQKPEPIDSTAIRLLNELITDTGACIVISSSWRIAYSLYQLQKLLTTVGFRFPEKIIGATSDLSGQVRGQEIALWLQQVPVKSFVILDDDDDMEPVKDHLIQTTFEFGLQQKHIALAKKLLNI